MPSPPPPRSSKPTAPPPDIEAALFAYNHSDGYVTDVLDQAARYAAAGTRVLAAEQSPACQQSDLGPLPDGTAGKVVAYAEAQLGKPYQWGATSTGAFDCSGLAMMAYRAAGITIPRTSQQQWAHGPQVPASQAQSGDLVFFAGSDGTMTAPGHVGIVTGHGTMIDAPFTGQVVREESFSGSTDLAGFTRP
jgi:peptidoglycan DL-endopeptidase CwlO